MTSEIISKIEASFKAQKYFEVIKLVSDNLKNAEIDFTSKSAYMYAYSLIKVQNIELGISILNAIIKTSNDPEVLINAKRILKYWQDQQSIKLSLREYIEKGYELHPGLVVYKVNKNATSDSASPCMIWKIENNTVYAFPVKKYVNRGFKLLGYNYFKNETLTVTPNLMVFNKNKIIQIDFVLRPIDYKITIRDLYERFCILGIISDKPKNCFVEQMEKELAIEPGDIISNYNPTDKFHNYYIFAIDPTAEIYKGVEITHHNGQIILKNQNIVDIPFSTYIIEKMPVHPEIQAKLNAEILNFTDSIRRI